MEYPIGLSIGILDVYWRGMEGRGKRGGYKGGESKVYTYPLIIKQPRTSPE